MYIYITLRSILKNLKYKDLHLQENNPALHT